jgi:hypothetical protein
MRIDRVWAMPNKWTFQIKPIAKLLKEEIRDPHIFTWIDPYCGKYSPAFITNDLNPKVKAEFHRDALDFLKQFEPNSIEGGVLYDPPYSLRQLKECYDSIGIKPDPAIFRADYISKQKDIISRIVKPNGKAICFGWNSIGIGKTRGFKLERILLVPHGRAHNDTIVTVERKINGALF